MFNPNWVVDPLPNRSHRITPACYGEDGELISDEAHFVETQIRAARESSVSGLDRLRELMRAGRMIYPPIYSPIQEVQDSGEWSPTPPEDIPDVTDEDRAQWAREVVDAPYQNDDGMPFGLVEEHYEDNPLDEKDDFDGLLARIDDALRKGSEG